MQSLKTKNLTTTLYSFDIFDTLVTRKTATPKGIFLLMQELLKDNNAYSKYFRENFKNIRCETEDFIRVWLYKTKKYQDITFDEIYERIQINHSLTNSETDFLKNLEVQCEIQNLIPVDENIQKLKTLVNKNEQVILISDMYHSSETLKKILTQIDPVFESIKIYVSCEYRKTKSKSDLYKVIREELRPQNWFHTGDNINADFNSARYIKIKSSLYNYPKLKGYEKYALENDNLTTEYISGTAKNLRIKSNNNVYNFGASFTGPILYSYVNWIIENALKDNIEHLYFIARDGYIPKLIADIIIQEKNFPLKTHYLYGSRKAWRIPEEKTVENFINYVLTEFYEKLTPIDIAHRLGINKEEFERFSKIKCSNKILSRKIRRLIQKRLLDNPEFKTFLLNKHSENRKNLINYLKQEIDFSKNNFAFVDFNGSGRSQDILLSIISDLYRGQLNTFYFCCEINLSECKNSLKRIFMCSNKYKHYWLELLCRNTEGQTIGYTAENDKIIPVLEKINNKNLISWGFEQYIKGIFDFTKSIIRLEQNLGISLNQIDFYFSYFNYITTAIDKETAEILGSIPYSNIGNEKNIKECAPAYNLFQFLFCKKQDFLFISKGRSSKAAKFLIDKTIQYKSLRKFFIDVNIHKKKREAFICILGKKININKFII